MFIEPDDLEIWKSELNSDFKLFDYDASAIELNIDEKQNQISSKNNERSKKSCKKGIEKASENLWREAMKFYNRSICEATVDSVHLNIV